MKVVIDKMLMGILVLEMAVAGTGMVGFGLTAIFTDPPPMCAPGEAQLAGGFLIFFGGITLAAARKGLRVNFSV